MVRYTIRAHHHHLLLTANYCFPEFTPKQKIGFSFHLSAVCIEYEPGNANSIERGRCRWCSRRNFIVPFVESQLRTCQFVNINRKIWWYTWHTDMLFMFRITKIVLNICDSQCNRYRCCFMMNLSFLALRTWTKKNRYASSALEWNYSCTLCTRHNTITLTFARILYTEYDTQ